MFLHFGKKADRQVTEDKLRLNRNREIYLGDFGLVRRVAPEMLYLNRDHYAAPEMFRSSRHNLGVNISAFRILIYEPWTGSFSYFKITGPCRPRR
jgi:hypothetical protein